MALSKDKTLWQRVQNKFFIDSNYCWIWEGARATGYGRLSFRNNIAKTRVAHKVVYELLIGEVPEGLELDHLCRNRACVNPNHLEPVTHLENLRRSPLTNNGKTHCKNGHEFNINNTYTPPSRPDRRYCKPCQDERSKKHVLRRKEQAWLLV